MLKKRKYPVVRQYDQVDCAPAALLSVLRFYGGEDNLVHVRELCQTSSYGSSMYHLVHAAQKLGFSARGVRAEYMNLISEKMPCIAHVILENKLQHFIVIYKINEKGVCIGDPGKGLLKLSKKKFLEIWPQKAIILLKPDSHIHKVTNPAWYIWILRHVQKEKNWVLQSLFLGVVYTAFGLLTAVFIQLLIDKFIPTGEYLKISYTGLFLFLLLLIRAVSGYMRQRFAIELNKRLSIHINSGFITHLFQLPKKFFASRKTGDVTARIHDAIRIQQAILLITGTTIIDILIISGSFIFIFYFSNFLAWLSLAVVPLYGFILWFNSRKLKQEQNEVMKNYALVESKYIDSLTGIDEIFNFNGAPFFTQLNKLIFGNYQNKIVRLGLTRSRLSFFAELSAAIITIIVLLSGAIWVIDGNILLGEMMASYSLLANMFPSVNRLVDANISLQGASIASQRLLDMILIKKEKNDGKLPFKLNNSLQIINGFFSWPGEIILFSGINLHLKKGEISALWGRSGSGKSTLVQIIQRKHYFQSGQVFVDNTSAEKFELTDFRKNIALVPQDIKIFNSTLAENIICGRTLITVDKLLDKIKQLGMDSYLTRFDHGLFTFLGEDNRQLSGGEKQILALIRALLDQPQILIIDEGLNAIDVELESQIYHLIRDYAKTHVVLIISHNLRTIVKADNINILQNGKIIQSGSTKTLITQKGYFKSIWHLYRQTNGKEIFYI